MILSLSGSVNVEEHVQGVQILIFLKVFIFQFNVFILRFYNEFQVGYETKLINNFQSP